MRKNNLNVKGLSLSEAQSVSNQCNQRCVEINNKIASLSNCKKTISFNGVQKTIKEGVQIPENILELVIQKGKLSACQAFLMENIKAKKSLLDKIENEDFESTIEEVVKPKFDHFTPIPNVTEEWGWEQLTSDELCKYYEAESYAAHIGQFIHKGSKLEQLRNELLNIPSIEWIELEQGKKTPVDILKFHTPEQLLEIHEKFAVKHREYENTVNYYKAKVKNLVTIENARIANENGKELARVNKINEDLSEEYQKQRKLYSAAYEEASNKFESERQEEIKRIAALKIEVNPIFQSVIDKLLVKTK